MSRTTYRVEQRLPIPMRDGVVLEADLYLPEGEGPWPVLLCRTPYGKEDVFQTQFILNMQFADAVAAGFAVLVQDTRGRGGSTGTFTPFLNETDDAVDTLDWITQQRFSDDRVVMFGASYVGMTQWLAAISGHPALRGIIPALTSPEVLNGWITSGGAIQHAFLLQWVFEALAPNDLMRRYPSQSSELCSAIEALEEIRTDPQQYLMNAQFPYAQLATVAPYFADWMEHLEDDAFWKDRDPSTKIASVTVPILHIIGWNDIFSQGALRAFELGAGSEETEGHYLVAGPWSHGNMSDWQGDIWHGYDASAGAIGLQQMQLNFARAVVDGQQPDLPRVKYFLSGINCWRSNEEWPVSGTESLEWCLSEPGELTPHRLTNVTASEAVIHMDPADPVPSLGGPTFLPGLLQGRNSAQKDQNTIEKRDDVLTFTSNPLSDDLQLLGASLAELLVRSDVADTDWSVRICDVSPEGVSLGVSDGFFRAQLLETDDGYESLIRIDLSPTGHVFRKHHRVRVQIAASNYPRFDLGTHQRAVRQSGSAHGFCSQTVVLGDAANPSRISMPIVAK